MDGFERRRQNGERRGSPPARLVPTERRTAAQAYPRRRYHAGGDYGELLQKLLFRVCSRPNCVACSSAGCSSKLGSPLLDSLLRFFDRFWCWSASLHELLFTLCACVCDARAAAWMRDRDRPAVRCSSGKVAEWTQLKRAAARQLRAGVTIGEGPCPALVVPACRALDAQTALTSLR